VPGDPGDRQRDHRKAVATITVDGRIVIEDLNRDAGPPENHKAVYLAGYHLAETQLAARLKSLIGAPRTGRRIDAEKVIPWIQEKLAITLAERQLEAIRTAADHKVMVITGGPGTGKTTIINALIRIFSGIRTKVLLAAPTGRAAKRMTEATGQEARRSTACWSTASRRGDSRRTRTRPWTVTF
jgi:exodeoxyribonuclease V alpha subunit